ncbi:hypothetical protein KXW57_007255 [Aspergillus fumigatus]|nr:hypothetical protein KXX01_004307 [Aspergillus fumigatus]KAH1932097.1 hypothetical protein KXV48_007795 [Aspergillus fumigatus]KAH2045043.1 hypothetical protein KXV43_005542 [Aspergillus fumigatus]KAH2387390.1 hypothetical protein KXW92_004420 [Aspergillus fumigatus]KAH3150997.1 hypothetical protein KXW80_009334 [Aspergillus fumigatus]
MTLIFIGPATYGAGPFQVRFTTGVEPSRGSIRVVTKTGKYSLAWIELNRGEHHSSNFSAVIASIKERQQRLAVVPRLKLRLHTNRQHQSASLSLPLSLAAYPLVAGPAKVPAPCLPYYWSREVVRTSCSRT